MSLMALLPEVAEIRLLTPEDRQAGEIDPIQLIWHTAVGSLRGTEAYFNRDDVAVESHFGTGGTTDVGLDGAVWQWMDTTHRADANRAANASAVSVETSDGGDPARPWSPAQLKANIKLGRASLAAHPKIARRICRTPTDPGIGWHAMWLGTRYQFADGTTPWTVSRGKTCPGTHADADGYAAGPRITQLQQIVIPAILADAPTQGDWLDMATPEEVEAAVYNGVMRAQRDFYAQGVIFGQDTFADTYRVLVDVMRRTLTEEQQHTTQLTALIAAVTPPPEPPPVT